jgi:hypothetical protein
MIGNTAKHISQSSLRINAVELGRASDAYPSATSPSRSGFGPVTQVTAPKFESIHGLLIVKPSIRDRDKHPEVSDDCLEGLAR